VAFSYRITFQEERFNPLYGTVKTEEKASVINCVNHEPWLSQNVVFLLLAGM